MEIRVERKDDQATLFLGGAIDIEGSEALKAELAKLSDGRLREAVLDFADVTFIGSSGIGKLLLFYKNFSGGGGRVRVARLNANLLSLFRAIKLDKLFQVD